MKEVISISLTGAGLVILGLMMLWFLMDILVRVTSRKRKIDVDDDGKKSIEQQSKLELMQQTAAASTAVAIALLKTPFISSEEKVNQRLTAWQTVHRHQQLHNHPKTIFINRNKK